MNQRFALSTLAILVIFLLGLSACGLPPRPASTPPPLPTATSATAQAGDFDRNLTVDGLERTYNLHIPAGLDRQQPVPLVFVFHGYQESGFAARVYTKFNQISDANGFIVVYPEGTGESGSQSWNANACCGYALQNNVDDKKFIRQMIAAIGTLVSVDSQRVYATGFSNGALLSYKLACEMPDTFAAVAPVAGVLVTTPCQPGQPVSLLVVNGMRDLVVPYNGGTNGYGITFPPIEPGLATWAQIDGCNNVPQIENTGTVHHSVYPDCKAGIGLEFYAIDDMEHAWPSPYATTPSISQTIWEFFAAHPKP